MTQLGEDHVLVPSAGELCEGPCWDSSTQTLVWVDILVGRVHVMNPSTGVHQQHEVDSVISAVAPRRGGGWIAAVERGFALFDRNWKLVAPVVPAPGQTEGTRFNDGRCDPQGRFWAGTLAYDGSEGAGALYRFDPDGTVTQVLDGVTNSNGLGWSPTGDTMYYVDTGSATIDWMAFDASTGSIGERSTLVAVPASDGLPDGLTVDSEGYLWLALWNGGCVRRYSPAGQLDRTVAVAARQVTSMAFGGAMLDELFITTARQGLSRAQLAHQPLAGSVFRHRAGVSGKLPNMFAG